MLELALSMHVFTDDQLSASQLRARYSKGGELDDSALTASQLRARHNIQANSKDWSTASSGQGGGSQQTFLVIGIAVLLLFAALGYMLLGRGVRGKDEL